MPTPFPFGPRFQTRGTRNGPRRRAIRVAARRVGARRRESWSKVVVEEGERFVSAVGDGCGRSRAQNGRPRVALATGSGGAGTLTGGRSFRVGGGHY